MNYSTRKKVDPTQSNVTIIEPGMIYNGSTVDPTQSNVTIIQPENIYTTGIRL